MQLTIILADVRHVVHEEIVCRARGGDRLVGLVVVGDAHVEHLVGVGRLG